MLNGEPKEFLVQLQNMPYALARNSLQPTLMVSNVGASHFEERHEMINMTKYPMVCLLSKDQH